MAEDGPPQMSPSGQQDLAEITSHDFPGERLIACRNPVLAAERAYKREALLAGFYMLRTSVLASQLRPIHHRPEERVKAHVLICMLACYLTWHLRKAWAPLTFTGENPPAPASPVAPARRSAAAQAKASRQRDTAGRPSRSFRGLLEHLATLTRNQVRFAGTHASTDMLTEPTSAQREAFDMIGVPIPLTLK